jgi:hypothetical protein
MSTDFSILELKYKKSGNGDVNIKKYRLSSCPEKKDGNPVFSYKVKTT